MKKELRTVLLAIFIIICNIATVSLAANEQVTLTSSKKDVRSGETFEITISQQSDGLTGFESTLNYDKNIFSLEKKELGKDWIDIGNDTKLDAMSNSAVSSGEVFKLTFKVKENVSATTSEIKLAGIKLYKTSSDSVEVQDKAVSINVAGGSSSDNNNNNNNGEELKGITLDYTNLTLVLGITTRFGIRADANPSTATLPKIVWSTSDERIAKLEETDTNGGITIIPVSAGNVQITAKTSDGRYSATCNVTVNANGNASGNTSNTGNNSNGTNTVNNNTNKNTNTNTNTNTNKVTNTTDNTTTTSNLPKTGSTTKYILLIVAGLIGISFIAYKGYKKYKEI